MKKLYYQLDGAGCIRYTPEGLEVFGSMFREHGIRITQICTRQQHDDALEYCAEEALAQLYVSPGVNPVDVAILDAIMLSADNSEAMRLMRERDARRRRAGFWVV